MADDSAGLIDQERRRSPRLRVLFTGLVADGQTVRPVRLIDISALGVSLVGDEVREVGTLVQFQRNDVQTDARVAWNSGRRSGLEFREPIATSAMVRRIATPRAQVPQQCRRPALTPKFLNKVDSSNNEPVPRWWTPSRVHG